MNCNHEQTAHACYSLLQVPRVDGITVLDDGTAAQDAQASDSDSSAGTSDSDSAADSDEDTQTVPVSRRSPASKQKRGQQQLQRHDDLQDFQNIQERREETKQQMAVTASKLLQNPEANLSSMRSLLVLAADKDSQVCITGLQCPCWLCCISLSLHLKYLARKIGYH